MNKKGQRLKTSIRNAVKRQVLCVLDRHGELQSNLSSEACREAIADSIIAEVTKHFSFSVKPFLPLDYTIDMEARDEFDN